MKLNMKNFDGMKKIMMILACVVAMTTVACEKYEDGRPSKDVRTEFNKMYPDAKDVEWGHEPGCWVVSFETGTPPNVLEHEARYEADGTWVGTVTEYTVNSVPKEIRNYLAQSDYGKYPVVDDDVDFCETPTGSYYVFAVNMNGATIPVRVWPDGKVDEPLMM